MSGKVIPHEIRFRVDPRDVPAEKAARRLHISINRFNELLPRLLQRGFPPADPDTGNFDLDAIDHWRKLRNPHLFGLTPVAAAPQPVTDRAPSPGERFVAFQAEQANARRKRRRPAHKAD
jgi:hypothetical protein